MIFCNFDLKEIDMNVQTTKEELIKMILDIENDQFIEKITEFIQKEKVDFWNELSFTEQKEIKKGIQELDNGKKVSFDSFLKKIS